MDASLIRKTAWDSLKGNYWTAVLAAFLAAIFGALLTSSNIDFNINLPEDSLNFPLWEELPRTATLIITAAAAFGAVTAIGFGSAAFILGGVVQLGYCTYLLKQQDRHPGNIRDLFSKFDYFGQGFLQALLRNLYTFLWGLLFIIPGIVKRYSYAMTPFIMAENPDMKAKDAIRASMELMDGHKGDLFWLELTFIGWDFLCLLTLGIGTIFLNPYKNAAHAAFYRSITAERIAAAAPKEPPQFYSTDNA